MKELLKRGTKEPRDALPYTYELKKLLSQYNSRADSKIDEATLMHGIFSVAKRGGFGGGRRSKLPSPKIDLDQRVFIGRWIGSRLASRASIIYTREFDERHNEYSRKFGNLSKSEFWRIVDRVAKSSKGEDWHSLLSKARDSACLAVETYNKPLISFKSEAFITLMVIAWTSLFQAFFCRIGISPSFEHDIDEAIRYWDLSTCLKKFFGSENSSVSKNLEFFIGLRNQIEHYKCPELDPQIFGECQAMVMNFEDLLVCLFGEKEALANRLTLAIQFSRLRNASQEGAMRQLQKPLPDNVREYVDKFRSQLSTDIWNSLEYSYRVFLIPKIDSKENRSDVAVQFAPFDPKNSEDLEQLENLKGFIVEKQVAVANDGLMKATKVCNEVKQRLGENGIRIEKFSPSYHHVKVARHYNIRPAANSKNPKKTKSEFCVYDPAHEDYLYTSKWVSFLVKEFSMPGKLEKALNG